MTGNCVILLRANFKKGKLNFIKLDELNKLFRSTALAALENTNFKWWKKSPTTTHFTGPILFSHSENPVSSRTLQIKDEKKAVIFVKLMHNEEQFDFIRHLTRCIYIYSYGKYAKMKKNVEVLPYINENYY